LPLYHQRGHLRASFGTPTAQLAPDTADCKGGADVTLPVTEGLVYLWDKAEWVDAGALSAPELNGVLNMKEGEVADGAKIERGWHKVLRAYGHIGYLDARLKTTATFDDANRRVSYVVQLTPGAQYHLAMFSINGLSETEAARVRSAWALAPGAVFDNDYLEAFDKKLVEMRLKGAGTRFKEVKAETKADRQRHTVDVVITFK
jgi:outer membrane protein insertion porin family